MSLLQPRGFLLILLVTHHSSQREAKWLNVPHLPQVLLPDRSAGWWMKMTTWPSETLSPTIPHTHGIHHCLCLSNTLFELVLRWTRPARRASSSRSAISWLTSFSRGGRSLAARSRRGRWGECYMMTYSIYFLGLFFFFLCLSSFVIFFFQHKQRNVLKGTAHPKMKMSMEKKVLLRKSLLAAKLKALACTLSCLKWVKLACTLVV